jgi:hypothetical protein
MSSKVMAKKIRKQLLDMNDEMLVEDIREL